MCKRLVYLIIFVLVLGFASGECPDGDLDDDCDCDVYDLLIFALQWLATSGTADIAPLGAPDGIVNMLDFAIFSASWQDAGDPLKLVINEMMASNSTAIADGEGEFDDWIEIYNPGPSAVDMAGMVLADNGNTWTIPYRRYY